MSQATNQFIRINIRWQTLELFAGVDAELIKSYPIASAANGIGQLEGSECTPLGKHHISEKIGDTEPVNTVFVGRKPTGEIYSDEFAATQKPRDWILTRILWLDGLDEGFNQGLDESGSCCDTKQRYICIHGCPDMIELFDYCAVGDIVSIVAM